MKDDLRALDELLEADRLSFEGAAPDLSGLFSQVAAQTVDREPSWRDRLRELPTWIRAVLVCCGVLVAGIAFLAAVGLRGDLSGISFSTYALASTAVLVTAFVSIRFSLRAFDERPLGPVGWGMGAVAVVLPLLLGFAPWPGITVPPEMAAFAMAKCTVGATMFAAWTTGLIAIFDRSDNPSAWRWLMAAGAGGLAGFTFTGLHCPGADLPHMVLGHGLSGIAVAAAALGVWWLRQR